MKKPLLKSLLLILLPVLILALTWLLFISGDVSGFKDYHLKDFPLSIKLPETTSATGGNAGRGEVLFSSYLSDEKLGFKGYIQLWSMPDLERFLTDGKLHSHLNFTSYDRRAIEFKSYHGYQLDWTALLRSGDAISARECYLKKKLDGQQVLRLSIIVDGGKFPEHLEHIAHAVITSIEWN